MKLKKRNTMAKILYFSLILLCFGCTQNTQTEKHQNQRNKIIDVRDKIETFEIDEILISNYPRIQLVDEYLMIIDYESSAEYLHILNKDNFRYITSTANKGQGPFEITNPGSLAYNPKNREFYITDHGKQAIFRYNLDSVLRDSIYHHTIKTRINKNLFPNKYYYINDTLSIGTIIELVPSKSFNQILAKWNMETGAIRKMNYTHPEIERKRVCFDISTEHGIYVECYSYHDLITICTLDGDLLYNIYGKKYNNTTSNKTLHYNNVLFCGDKILATYYGGDTFYYDKKGEIKSNSPTLFHVFDLQGNYLKSLETGNRIIDVVYDTDNHRLIMTLDEEYQFAYLPLDGLI